MSLWYRFGDWLRIWLFGFGWMQRAVIQREIDRAVAAQTQIMREILTEIHMEPERRRYLRQEMDRLSDVEKFRRKELDALHNTN